jgi:hypothetical protein
MKSNKLLVIRLTLDFIKNKTIFLKIENKRIIIENLKKKSLFFVFQKKKEEDRKLDMKIEKKRET